MTYSRLSRGFIIASLSLAAIVKSYQGTAPKVCTLS